jgi:copper(I)-binding protein
MNTRGVLFALFILCLVPSLAAAHEFGVGSLRVVHPWARFTPPGAPNGAVYLAIENRGAEADRLIGAATPRAERVELHASEEDGGVYRMVPREAVEVKPGETVRFAPGGLHVMLFGLSATLKQWETFPLTLRFEQAGTLEVEVQVEAEPSHGAAGGGHDAGGMKHAE